MLIVILQSKAVAGTELDIKEVLAMYCEQLGNVTFPNIDHKENSMILTMHLHAPDGSVPAFSKMIRPYLNKYRDTQVLEVREVLPQQMEI